MIVTALVLAALNLRPAIAGVSPLLGDIMADLRLGPASGGMVTTVMVVCLGLAAPAAPFLVRRCGLDRTALAGLVVLTAGIVLRSAGGAAALYAGAAVAGLAIAVLNVLMPALVKHHFPERTGVLTSVYVTALVLGATAGAGLAVPLERAIGHGWRPAAAATALLSAAAAAVWLPLARGRARPATAHQPVRTLLRTPMTWYVTGFMGLQSLTFYVVLAWLPTVFTDAGLDARQAGYLLALSTLVQIVTTLSVPVLAGRAASQAGYVVAAGVLTIAGYLGILLAPATASWMWAVLLGLGQGASIALALLLIALRSPDPSATTSLSAVAQSVGYLVAAAGPVLVGVVLQATGGWTVPLTLVIGVAAAQIAVGALAGRPAPDHPELRPVRS